MVTLIVAAPLVLADRSESSEFPSRWGWCKVTVGLGISAVLLLDAVTVSGCDSPPPAEMPDRLTVCAPASSLMVRLPIAFNVGASLTAVTVSTKLSLALSEPSLTVTVIVAVPLASGAGVTVTVRLAPLPPNTMLAVGH